MELVTLDFIKQYLEAAQYSRASTIQSRLSDVISDYVNAPLEPTTFEDEVYDSKSLMILYNMPIISVESMLDVTGDPVELVENTDFYVYPQHIFLPSRTNGRKDLKISYTAGFKVLPPLFFVVAEDLVRYWAFKENRGDELFFQREAMEDRSYQTKDMDELTILSRLSRYKQESLSRYPKKSKLRIGVI